MSENLEIELFENIIKLLLKYSPSLQITYLLIGKCTKNRSAGWISHHFRPENYLQLQKPPRYRRREERQQDEPSKSFCPTEICTNPNKLHIKTRRINSTLWIWQRIYYSENALSRQSSFSRPSAFKTRHAFVNLHPNRRKKIFTK